MGNEIARIGDTVINRKFGFGVIVSVNGSIIRVLWDGQTVAMSINLSSVDIVPK